MKCSFRLSAVSLYTLGSLLALSGCSSTPVDETAGWSPNKIYSEAIEERDAGNFERSVTLLERELVGRQASAAR